MSSRDHYEPVYARVGSTDFLRLVHSRLTGRWVVSTADHWLVVTPRDHRMRRQGWKIHLSATLASALRVLAVASRICAERLVPFKCALTPRVLDHLNSKEVNRASGGKFITIYPASDEEFLELLTCLAADTAGLAGPHILSDRRVEGSSVVHYRYGTFRPPWKLEVSGVHAPQLTLPDGTLIAEERVPYWNPPHWLADPLLERAVPSRPDGPVADDHRPTTVGRTEPPLLGGRFAVERAIRFSNVGGQYLARDTETGAQVLVKEARPYVAEDAWGRTAVDRLRAEAQVLEFLENDAIAPRHVTTFDAGTHTFLVREYLPDAMTFGHFVISRSPILGSRCEDADMQGYLRDLAVVATAVWQKLQLLHARGVAHGDLSPLNILVWPDADRFDVRMIDFEAGVKGEPHSGIGSFTLGYCAPGRPQRHPSPDDDVFGFAQLLSAAVVLANGMFHLDPAAQSRFLDFAVGCYSGFALLKDVVDECLQERPDRDRIGRGLSRLQDAARGQELSTTPRHSVDDTVTSVASGYDHDVEELVSYIIETCDEARADLFPTDAVGFNTPLALGRGAVGTIWALDAAGVDTDRYWSWVLQKSLDHESVAPGLFTGLSGVAWALLDRGDHDLAGAIAADVMAHPAVLDSVDVYQGASGVGLFLLKMYAATRDSRWLELAQRLAEQLKRRVGGSGDIAELEQAMVGYAHGHSGVAAFFMYLGAATEESSDLALAEAILDQDLGLLRRFEGGIARTPRFRDSGTNVYSPYWSCGSAGVGLVALRMYVCTGQQRFRDAAEELSRDCFPYFVGHPGFFTGMAGLASFQLDMARFLENDAYRFRAQELARVIRLFFVRRPAGVCVPGDQLSHLCASYGYGSAGVISVFLQLAAGETEQRSFGFLPDELLVQTAAAAVPRPLTRPAARV